MSKLSLLWKLPQMPSCSANNANLDKNYFDMFYKIDCCAAIHGRIWMNNVPNKSRIIMLSCTEISFVISFFDFEKFGVKCQMSVNITQLIKLHKLKTWTKTVLTCFTKIIAEQPSLTQYERPMYNMKEK